MKKTRRIKKTKTYFWHYLLVAVLVFTSGAIAGYLYFKPMLAFKAPFIENIESQRLRAKSDDKRKDSLRLYKSPQKDLLEYDDRFRKDTILVTAEDIIKKYIDPYGGELLDLYMDKEGTIYVDFSSELRKKFNGDAFDEYLIIAGLYKKLRINVPNFNSLKILINGKETESFGGHIDISRPIGGGIEGVDKGKTYRYF